MSSVTDCAFMRDALEEAQDTEKVIMLAESCGCGGECTLENGCILFKGHYDKPDEEQAFFRRLRSEFVGHMLGE